MSISTIMSTFTIASIYAILGFGVFISFKILNITDLTVEASFGFGAAISGMMCRKANVDALVSTFGNWISIPLPFLSLICAFLGGSVAGLITAILHTKLKINSVLSGILTLTAFYTINLITVGKNTSIGLSGKKGVTLFPDSYLGKMFIMFGITILIGVALAFFFKTRLGLSIRACGDNEQMTKTQCISTDLMKTLGLSLSNGLVGLSGALFIQCNANYSTNLEQGMMVVGVATIIIGEIIALRKHNISIMLVGIFSGSVIYRFIYAISLRLPFIKTTYLHLITAGLIVSVMLVSKIVFDLKLKKRIKNNDTLLEIEEKNLINRSSLEEE